MDALPGPGVSRSGPCRGGGLGGWGGTGGAGDGAGGVGGTAGGEAGRAEVVRTPERSSRSTTAATTSGWNGFWRKSWAPSRMSAIRSLRVPSPLMATMGVWSPAARIAWISAWPL